MYHHQGQELESFLHCPEFPSTLGTTPFCQPRTQAVIPREPGLQGSENSTTDQQGPFTTFPGGHMSPSSGSLSSVDIFAGPLHVHL